MRICFLNRAKNDGRFGGDLVLIDALAEALRQKGHDVHVGDYTEEPDIFANSADIVHLNNIQQHWTETFVRYYADKKPLVLTPFFLPEHDSTMLPPSAQNMILDKVQAIILTGEMEHDAMRESLNIDEHSEKVHYIPNGARRMFLADDDIEKEKCIIASGRIEARKNLEYIAEITKDLGVPLYITGKIPHKEWTQECIIFRKLKEYSHVHFTGFLTDTELVNSYKRAKVFIQDSLSETDSQAPYEAILAGCNVIVGTTTQSMRENSSLLQFSSVYAIDESSRKDVPQKILDFLEMKNDGKAKQWVYENRTWDVLAEQYEDVYRKLL